MLKYSNFLCCFLLSTLTYGYTVIRLSVVGRWPSVKVIVMVKVSVMVKVIVMVKVKVNVKVK